MIKGGIDGSNTQTGNKFKNDMFFKVLENINKNYIPFSFIPLLFFWFLDAFFLKTERQYRRLYAEVSKKDEKEIDFSMDITPHKECYGKALSSRTLLPFYLPLIGIVLVIIFIVK